MQKIVKCKPVDKAEGTFNLVEEILKGDVSMHWLEFKWIEVTMASKNSNSCDTVLLGMCNPTFAICSQKLKLKKHYFPKNFACLQKAYLCSHIKKPNKLSIKNTAMRLCNVNGMLVKFPVPGNNMMANDELWNILYHMAKHDWHGALCKSGRNPSNMNSQDLVDYFKQIKLLKVVKQKSKTIVVDDNNDK
eukprot:1385364-Ditylum_brightwellii.AAC.1